MIEPIHWPKLAGKENPFATKSEDRVLEVTVHVATQPADADERLALQLLREFAEHRSLDIADTTAGAIREFRIGEFDAQRGFRPVRITRPDGLTKCGVWGSEDWPALAASLCERYPEFGLPSDTLFQDISIAEAHRQNYRDLLITDSSRLLIARDRFPAANIRTLIDGVRVVGLYLRSRDDYTYQCFDRGGRSSLDRGLFYWVLCRQRLPAMWRYFAGCLAAAKVRRDDSDYLGNTVLVRLVRSLQARDEIGKQFYLAQNNSTRDVMLYHFDYLTLLLVGVLDAQARIARRVYRIAKPVERRASFKDPVFRECLHQDAGELADYVDSSAFQDYRELLWSLRNTIHGAANWPIGVSAVGEPERSMIKLTVDSDVVWRAAQRLGRPEQLGIEPLIGVGLEPYTCAEALVRLCFVHANRIAELTDIGRLGLDPEACDALPDGPPDERDFAQAIRERLAILG